MVAPRRSRRGRAQAVDCPMCLLCSFEDAFWWIVAFVAVVVLVNYAYFNLSPSHHYTDWRSWLGTKQNDPGGCHCTGDSFGEYCKGIIGRTMLYLPTQPDALKVCESKELRGALELGHYFTGDNHLEGLKANLSRLDEAIAVQEFLKHLEDPVHCFHGATQYAFKAYSIPSKLPLTMAVTAALPALSEAARAGKAFQFLPQNIPTRPKGAREFCRASSPLACLLEPLGTCGAINAPKDREVDLKDPLLEVNLPPRDVSTRSLPARFRGLGSYWYYTQLLKHAWRPNKPAKMLIDLLEEGLQTKGKRMVCAYIHNCRGGKDVAEQKIKLGGCVGQHTWLDRLMPAVGEIGMRYNISTVFLISDSIRPVAATSKYQKFTFKHLLFSSSDLALGRLQDGRAPPPPTTEWLGGSRFRDAPKAPSFTPQWATEMVAAHPDLLEFAQLEFLSRCTAFVGPFIHAHMQLGYQLAVARQGFYPPFISTDHPIQQLSPPVVVKQRGQAHA